MSNKNNFSINDFDKMCRTCSAMHELHPLYENATLLVMLRSCTQIRYDEFDDLPKQICQHCIQQLIQMYNFANKCKMIDNALRKCQKNLKPKEEPPPNREETSKPVTYKCLSCPKTYGLMKDLKLHMFTHAQEKPFKCQICNRGFLKNSLLKHHLRIHTGEKPYVCNVCNKKFRHPHSLTVHLRVHTGLKPYSCDFDNCQKAFSQISCLIIHKRIHTNERPFRCEVCGKTWISSHKLRVHSRTHTGEKKHVCSICGKGFTQAVNLRNHGKIHDAPNSNNA